MSSQNEKSFFCPLPWRHLSIEPSGNVYTCCNAKPSDFLGSTRDSSLLEIWEGEKLSHLRDMFRSEKIPKQCETCVFQENNGQISLREASLKEFSLEEKDTLNNGQLSFLGLRFGNTCNMSCRICSSGLSTSWYADERKLGKEVPLSRLQAFDETNFLELLNLIEQQGQYLYFAGGEPFLQPEFLELLKFLERKNLFDMKIMINSNGSTLGSAKDEYLKLLPKFKNLFLELSLDDFGKRAEYSRKGASWQDIEENIKTFKRLGLNIFITPTVSIFNIYYLDEFLDYALKAIKIPCRNIRLTVLRQPEHYNIAILPIAAKSVISSKLSKFQKQLLLDFDSNDILGLLNELGSVKKSLDQSGSSLSIKDFYHKTMELDQVREEDFSSVFFEFKSILE